MLRLHWYKHKQGGKLALKYYQTASSGAREMKQRRIYAALDIHLNSASLPHKRQLDLRAAEIYGCDTVQPERLTSCGSQGD